VHVSAGLSILVVDMRHVPGPGFVKGGLGLPRENAEGDLGEPPELEDVLKRPCRRRINPRDSDHTPHNQDLPQEIDDDP